MIVLAIVFLQVTAIGGVVALRLLVPPEVAKGSRFAENWQQMLVQLFV